MTDSKKQSGADGPPRLFFVAGEPSGDLHAANLIEALLRLRPGAECVGLGGPRMQAAGCRLRQNMMDMSWMWFSQVLFGLRKVLRLERETLEYLDANRPDAAVLVDFPGFNLRLARSLAKRGIPVVYYIGPQIWAWAPWRIRKIRRRVAKMLVIFPFEEELYRRAGVDVEYVGHPLSQHLRDAKLDESFPEMIRRGGHTKVVGLLPGSRYGVVQRSVPVMFHAAETIHRQMPETHFVVSRQQEQFRALIQPWVKRASFPIQVVDQHTLELMRHADLCLVSSGTATLELAHYGTPMVVVYRVELPSLWLGRLLMRTKHFSLVNVLAGKEVVPEFLLWRDGDRRVAEAAMRILGDEGVRERMKEELARVREKVDWPGGSERAAEAVLRFVEAGQNRPGTSRQDPERAGVR